MKINELRHKFLSYFNENEHEIVHSSPLVPNNDPTLMFANSGMVQFKNVFTGMETRDYKRAATAQKCIRAGGKHNDLENVGYTLRHHTFFEMLGNFSFGDYFKDDAIFFAWNFITKELQINKDKLCVTIYHDDDEAYAAWKKISGLHDDKIIRISTNDNFWSMGDTGPCGPCSEIFYDHGEKYNGKPPSEADETHDRFVEIWNLVFMQYEQVSRDNRVNLPKPSIDTGMGIERITAVMQETNDNYNIDIFQNLINNSIDLTGNNNPKFNTSHRVIADHLRSSCFLIADGVLPSNEGRGYVLRRIMRRAMRHVHILGYSDTLLNKLSSSLISEMSEAYPELSRAENLIHETLLYEEIKFKDLLVKGIKQLDEELTSFQSGQIFPGNKAFKLYDTYGFPLDLTQDILRQKNIEIDLVEFNKSLENQKNTARQNWSGSGDLKIEKIWFELSGELDKSNFIGYEKDQSQGKILALVKEGKKINKINFNETASIIMNQTVFYAESGGQIGDKGIIKFEENFFEVNNTQKKEGLIIHFGKVIKGSFNINDTVEQSIEIERRTSCRAYHSATHILHQALRDTLGEHVTQKGSLVSHDRLRFDFSHHKSLSDNELNEIEAQVNKIISSNLSINTKIMSYEDALETGALALFGEKYEDEVRVVMMNEDKNIPYSVELCGGTHVNKTSDIKYFIITNETSVASGIRRIEALRGEDVRSYKAKESQLQNENQEKQKDLDQLKAVNDKRMDNLKILIKDKIIRSHFNYIVEIVEDFKTKSLRSIIDLSKKHFDKNGIIVLCVKNDDKISFLVGVTEEYSNQLPAGDIAKFAAEVSNGKGGGGRKDFAQSGGVYDESYPIKEKIEEFIKSKI